MNEKETFTELVKFNGFKSESERSDKEQWPDDLEELNFEVESKKPKKDILMQVGSYLNKIGSHLKIGETMDEKDIKDNVV